MIITVRCVLYRLNCDKSYCGAVMEDLTDPVPFVNKKTKQFKCGSVAIYRYSAPAKCQ